MLTSQQIVLVEQFCKQYKYQLQQLKNSYKKINHNHSKKNNNNKNNSKNHNINNNNNNNININIAYPSQPHYLCPARHSYCLSTHPISQQQLSIVNKLKSLIIQQQKFVVSMFKQQFMLRHLYASEMNVKQAYKRLARLDEIMNKNKKNGWYGKYIMMMNEEIRERIMKVIRDGVIYTYGEGNGQQQQTYPIVIINISKIIQYSQQHKQLELIVSSIYLYLCIIIHYIMSPLKKQKFLFFIDISNVSLSQTILLSHSYLHQIIELIQLFFCQSYYKIILLNLDENNQINIVQKFSKLIIVEFVFNMFKKERLLYVNQQNKHDFNQYFEKNKLQKKYCGLKSNFEKQQDRPIQIIQAYHNQQQSQYQQQQHNNIIDEHQQQQHNNIIDEHHKFIHQLMYSQTQQQNQYQYQPNQQNNETQYYSFHQQQKNISIMKQYQQNQQNYQQNQCNKQNSFHFSYKSLKGVNRKKLIEFIDNIDQEEEKQKEEQSNIILEGEQFNKNKLNNLLCQGSSKQQYCNCSIY